MPLLDILVPAYIYPTLPAWGVLEGYHSNNTIAVMNPASGPGVSSNPDWVSEMLVAQGAGIAILGYVATDYGNIDPIDVKDQIDSYNSWYNVDGIFFDEVLGDVAHVGYYQDLIDYVDLVTPGNDVVFNEGIYPEQAFVNGLSAGPGMQLIHVAFEGSYSSYITQTIPGWAVGSGVVFADLVYDVSTIGNMQIAVQLARGHNSRYVYVTPDVLPNPWDTLSSNDAETISYWSEFVDAILEGNSIMPGQISGTLGSKLFISNAAIASTIDSEFEFMAQNYTEIALIENLGELGRVFDPVTFQAIADGRTYKLKGGYNDGNMQMTLGQDITDAGQDILFDAANASSQDNYGFKLEMNDEASTSGGPTTFYFRGLAMSFRTQMGAVNSVVRAMVNLEINSPIIMTGPAELFDRFVTGGSLAGYALFAGTDPQAIAPVITANALVGVTGDAGTGYAADGTQAISLEDFTLSAGPVVFEARVKISAITNVALFVGLTDQFAALEAPIESAATADTILTNATDAVGFFFDTAMATDNIWLAGVNAGVDETHQNSALAMVADTYRVFRMEVAANGDTIFYIDGAVVGVAMTTAIATGVALYPTIIAAARSTASRTITADYLYTRQD